MNNTGILSLLSQEICITKSILFFKRFYFKSILLPLMNTNSERSLIIWVCGLRLYVLFLLKLPYDYMTTVKSFIRISSVFSCEKQINSAISHKRQVLDPILFTEITVGNFLTLNYLKLKNKITLKVYFKK